MKLSQDRQDAHNGTLASLHTKYSAALRQFFARRLGNRDEAQDLTHDLLIKVAHRADVEHMENPEGFLFSAAANVLRDRNRRDRIASRHFGELTSTEKYIEDISPERVLISKQSLERIMVALEKLDSRARDVFILHRLEGMKYADIARIYGLSVSSIEKDMMRAIAHLASFAEL